VIKGVTKVTRNNQIRFFNAGQTLALSENEMLILENTGDESSVVVSIKTKSIHGDSSTVQVKGQKYGR
jgi:hypothetical protein